MLTRFFTLAASLLFMCQTTLADHPIKHLQVETPKSEAEALESFESNFHKVQEILSSPSLNTSDLDHIHIISYSLESAVAKLIESKETSQLLHLADTVEGLHLNSERHQQEATKEWFLKMKAAFEAIKK